jgi:hypothetical protein
VEKGQFIEVINLDDALTELVNNSAALRNIKSTKHWEPGAKNITSQQIMIRYQATTLITTWIVIETLKKNIRITLKMLNCHEFLMIGL